MYLWPCTGSATAAPRITNSRICKSRTENEAATTVAETLNKNDELLETKKNQYLKAAKGSLKRRNEYIIQYGPEEKNEKIVHRRRRDIKLENLIIHTAQL